MESTLHSQNCVPGKRLYLPEGRASTDTGQRGMALKGAWSESWKQPEPQHLTLDVLPSLGKAGVLRLETVLVCGWMRAGGWVLLPSDKL